MVTPRTIEIEQAMLDATRECVERAETFEDIHGLAFLTVSGGLVAIYHRERKQALRQRFDNVRKARQFAIQRLLERVH